MNRFERLGVKFREARQIFCRAIIKGIKKKLEKFIKAYIISQFAKEFFNGEIERVLETLFESVMGLASCRLLFALGHLQSVFSDAS
jgi:hypothetical protein